jgi:predicted TIM-barrel fold metal-dependent hydrolase
MLRKAAGGDRRTTLPRQYGELEPLPNAYRDREERLAVMDGQGVEKTFLFPTLGDCVEHLMHDNIPMAYAVFHAFNEWLDEDWGFNYQERLYSPPYIPMLDPELAVKELDFVLARGAKVMSIRPGPAVGRSPADPVWDPFWARMRESGTLAAYHAFGGPTVYEDSFDAMWGAQPVTDRQYRATLQGALVRPRHPRHDDGHGARQPVRPLPQREGGQHRDGVQVGAVRPRAARPRRRHPRPADRGLRHEGGGHALGGLQAERVHLPFPEEDVVGLAELIGTDHVLFGSD